MNLHGKHFDGETSELDDAASQSIQLGALETSSVPPDTEIGTYLLQENQNQQELACSGALIAEWASLRQEELRQEEEDLEQEDEVRLRAGK